MMGDLLYPAAGTHPVRVIDNGDGHYQVTVAAEPSRAIYPSHGEWKALEDTIRGAAAHITIPRPHVPFGPEGIPADQSDAKYLREAARRIERGYRMGSNLTATVVKLLHDTADAIKTGALPAAPAVVSYDYMIWSHEHRAWWGPNWNGYRLDDRDAGHYSQAEAQKICGTRPWRHPGVPPEVAIPAPSPLQLGSPGAKRRLKVLVDRATKKAVAGRANGAPEPCRYCTQCGKPMDPQDTAAGRRVCGECEKPCPSCCTEIGERYGPVDCVTCDGTGTVPAKVPQIIGAVCDDDGRIHSYYPISTAADPEDHLLTQQGFITAEAGETEGPGIVPAAGGEGP